MADFLAECNSGELRINDAQAFQQIWCARCSQRNCDLAKFAQNDPMAHRQATWQDHYFGKEQADLRSPKYAHIAKLDFPNLLERAIKLEISERRGDWSVPEINISDGVTTTAAPDATTQVEQAIRQLRQPSTGGALPIEEEPVVVDEPLVVEKPVEKPVVRKLIPQPSSGNTPDQGEILLGGGPSIVNRQPPSAEQDPWAPPAKPRIVVVKPGAVITMGKPQDD